MAGSVVTVIRTGAQVAIPVVTFAVGLGAGSLRLPALRRQRGLLGRALLAVLVVVPLLTVLLVKLLPLAPEVRAGLLTLAIAVGPIAALRKVGKGNGDADFTRGLNLALLLASLLYVPLAAKLVGAAFPRDLHVPMRAVLRPVILVQLVPLLAGLGLAWLAPRPAARLVKPVAITGNVLLGAVFVMALALLWRPMLRMGVAGLLATAFAAVLAIAAGHALGGPASRTRTTLASFCAMKFPAIGLVLATATQFGKRAVPVIVAYVLVGSVALAAYGPLRKAAARLRVTVARLKRFAPSSSPSSSPSPYPKRAV